MSRMRAYKGFTLAEMLVALVLLAVLTLALAGSINHFSLLGARGGAAAARGQRIVAVEENLRRLLASAVALRGYDHDDGHLYFTGGKTRLIWLASMPGRDGITRLHWLRLRSDKGRLVLDYRPFIRGGDGVRFTRDGRLEADFSNAGLSVLIPRLGRFSIRYMARMRPGEKENWRRDWQAREALPALIDLRLGDDDGAWPSLIVRPRFGEAPR